MHDSIGDVSGIKVGHYTDPVGAPLKEEWVYLCGDKKYPKRKTYSAPLNGMLASNMQCRFEKARFSLLTSTGTSANTGSTVSSIISFPQLMELEPSFWTSQRVLAAVTAEEKMTFDPTRNNKKKRLFATSQGSVRGTDLMHDDWKAVMEETTLYKVLLNRLKLGAMDKVFSRLNSAGPIKAWVMH